MKDINKLKNYRLKYKRYYNIDFSSDFSIHHIDLNHNDNDIDNLLLLPKKLHNKYHFYITALSNMQFPILIKGNQCNPNNYHLPFLRDFIEVIEECNKWYDYKMYLDGMIYNIHKIRKEDLL